MQQPSLTVGLPTRIKKDNCKPMNLRRQLRLSIFLLCPCGAQFPVLTQSKHSLYYPAAGDSWQHRRPEDVGMNIR